MCNHCKKNAEFWIMVGNFIFWHKGWSDIGYSFLVGGDGNIYEGRGWDRVGAHTSGYNSVGLAWSYIGSFTSVLV